MIDQMFQKPIKMLRAPQTAAVISVPLSQVERITALFKQYKITHWVSHTSLSVNNEPPRTMIFVSANSDQDLAQRVLDETT